MTLATHTSRVCTVCGAELAPYGGVGRPSEYCPRPAPCARYIDTLGKITAQARQISAHVGADSARRERFVRASRAALEGAIGEIDALAEEEP